MTLASLIKQAALFPILNAGGNTGVIFIRASMQQEKKIIAAVIAALVFVVVVVGTLWATTERYYPKWDDAPLAQQ